jgi:hypothetical protein
MAQPFDLQFDLVHFLHASGATQINGARLHQKSSISKD